MGTNIINREILIVHTSRFFSREINKNETLAEDKKWSENEHITEACWNGLIRKIFPEIPTPLSLTGVRESFVFLCLSFGEYDHQSGKEFSLCPYLFLNAKPGMN